MLWIFEIHVFCKINYFQRRVYKTTETIPEKLTGVLDVETFRKAKSYGIDKNTFSIAEEWFNMIISTVSSIILNNINFIWILCMILSYYVLKEDNM